MGGPVTQLVELTKPFHQRDIEQNPSGGGEYVKHSTVTEKLLYAVGPFDYRIVDVIRGHVAAIPPNPNGKSKRAKEGSPELVDAIVGCLAELTLTIDNDLSVVEVGDCEQPHNWPHDGARLKDASSDAIKRCAMRLGCGLHLWSQDSYRLHDALVKREFVAPPGDPGPAGVSSAGPDGGTRSGAVDDGEAPDEAVQPADPVGVVESSSTTSRTNTGADDTDQPVTAGGVVPEVELALDGSDAESVAASEPPHPISSARLRLDSVKGHK